MKRMAVIGVQKAFQVRKGEMTKCSKKNKLVAKNTLSQQSYPSEMKEG